MMGKRKNLHINLHSSHLCKRNSLYVSYLQRDTADLKSADLYRSWGFKSPSGHHLETDRQNFRGGSPVDSAAKYADKAARATHII